MAKTEGSNVRRVAVALAFLGPNILGFLGFTLLPLVFSLALAFSNWDLKKHNMFHPDQHIQFVGLANFTRLISQPEFWRYFGNTLYLLMGMPIGIAASLGVALLLSKDLYAGRAKFRAVFFAGAVLIASCAMLSAIGAGAAGMTILLVGLVGAVLVMGTGGGGTVYRTLLYLPNFTSGVATMLLWKKMFNPENGPINAMLSRPLEIVGDKAAQLPVATFTVLGLGLCLVLALCAALWGFRRIYRLLADGDLGSGGAIFSVLALMIPIGVAIGPESSVVPEAMRLPNAAATILVTLAAAVLIWAALVTAAKRTGFAARKKFEGMGGSLMPAAGMMIAEFILIGVAAVCQMLPAAARSSAGLQPPQWMSSIYWAKPGIMIMGMWGAIGSQTMLLYLAALMNVPAELYEAADLDGASRFGKFWNVTWPQLAPTTFFVVVMGVIGGLQGGFDAARIMPATPGGPAGSTTTLAYYIYSEGFETGRLGFSSAVAWTMFLLVMLVTLFNWSVGARYVND